jgi:hypothetical protein
LEEIRHLRRDLERSVEKQTELQLRIDENIRQSRTPREFTFSGRGVSYPDLRLIDASGLINAENLSSSSLIYEKRTIPVGSLSTEFDQIDYSREIERSISTNSKKLNFLFFYLSFNPICHWRNQSS